MIAVTRTQHRLLPQVRRVLAKPYLPGEETIVPGQSRAGLLLSRIMEIPEADLPELTAKVLALFATRHRDFREILERQFDSIAHRIDRRTSVSAERQLLIGAYFTHEYSVEAAALFNPSIVVAPDQTDAPSGSIRFVMSMRAVGEGHLSSIEFRTGLLDARGEVTIDEPSGSVIGGRRSPPSFFDKSNYRGKLLELGAVNDLSSSVMNRLKEKFTLEELEASLSSLEAHGPPAAVWFETAKIMRVLASSNYVTTFPPDSSLADRVIFPAGPNETRGMEDARFVRFTSGAGRAKYYATYTAYDGFSILPQLIETDDFARFTISTLHGTAAQNKGMALFPRLINGDYVMLSRKDRENLYLARSGDVSHWNDAVELYRPQRPWELLQIGNCGAPIETEAGWLVLTHGVGPMRRYAIGALLLDLADPAKVIGHLPAPLLEPEENEREGYVPNVLYTCGAIVHGGQLVIPYGFSDSGIAIARVGLGDLLTDLLRHGAG